MITRQFIAVDGEGYTDDNEKHIFNLLGTNVGGYVYDNAGLRTKVCFDYLLGLKKEYPDAIFVSFYFSYDVNMLLGNIPFEAIDRLKRQSFTYIYVPGNELVSYRIDYIARKFFTLTYCTRTLEESITKPGCWHRTTSIKIWDVFGFFQCSFVKALQEFNIGTQEQLQHLSLMKSQRSEFTIDALQDIIEYNKLECDLLVELMTQLDTSLQTAGLILNSWHGAGAVAQQLMTNHKMTEYIKQPTGNHKYPVLCAYFGGRIQTVVLGEIKQTIYTHDLVSAYPNAIQHLPALHNMRQKSVPNYDIDLPFTIWHVEWDLPDDTIIAPFPFRLKDGRIDYPLKGGGYYWDCEVRIAMKYYAQYITVHKGYQFEIRSRIKPFDYVPELFEQRKRFKREKNYAQYAIKLALNSLYGKTAQSTGIRKFQSYIWSGLITADTRSRMLDLAMSHPTDVIAFATDGLISKAKHCDNGDGTLGSWEVEEYHSILVFKPGLYTCRKKGGKTVRKVRGFMPKEVKFWKLRKEWRKWDIHGAIPIPCSRFIGMKATNDVNKWRTWVKDDRMLTMFPSVGLPEREPNLAGTIQYRITADRYDGHSFAYSGEMFNEHNINANGEEMESYD